MISIKGRKALGIGQMVGWILGLLALLAGFFIIMSLVSGGKAWESLYSPFTQAELKNDVYFTALTVGVKNDPLPGGCVKKAENLIADCDRGVKLNIVVNVKNIGSKAVAVYAKPKIGFSCSKSGKCENQAQNTLGTTRCIIPPGETVACDLGYDIDAFGEDGATYTIYPQASMLRDDYIKLTGDMRVLSNVDSLVNTRNYLTIKTK